jgi:hypothetical protein
MNAILKRKTESVQHVKNTQYLYLQYCAGGKIETNEMGKACGAYGGG